MDSYIDLSYQSVTNNNNNSNIRNKNICNLNNYKDKDIVEGFTGIGKRYLNKCCPQGSILNDNNECIKFCNGCSNISYNQYDYDIESADSKLLLYTNCNEDASSYYNYSSLNNIKNQFNLLNQYDLLSYPTNASLIKSSMSVWSDTFMNLINPDKNTITGFEDFETDSDDESSPSLSPSPSPSPPAQCPSPSITSNFHCCNPNAQPLQICPDGSSCPDCGSNSCLCPSSS